MTKDKPPIIFLLIPIIIGIGLVAFGIYNTKQQNLQTKNFVETTGYFVGTDIYSNDDNNPTYMLIYTYNVDGVDYYISTNYGTSFVPESGSKKTIQYNPNNPNDAIIKGFGANYILFLVGFIFIGFSLIPIMASSSKQYMDIIFSILIGLIFIGIGSMIFYFMCLGTDTISLKAALQSAGFMLLFPIVFVGGGILMIVSSIYYKIRRLCKKKEGYLTFFFLCISFPIKQILLC